MTKVSFGTCHHGLTLGGIKLNLSFSPPQTEKGKFDLWTYNMVMSKLSNTQK